MRNWFCLLYKLHGIVVRSDIVSGKGAHLGKLDKVCHIKNLTEIVPLVLQFLIFRETGKNLTRSHLHRIYTESAVKIYAQYIGKFCEILLLHALLPKLLILQGGESGNRSLVRGWFRLAGHKSPFLPVFHEQPDSHGHGGNRYQNKPPPFHYPVGNTVEYRRIGRIGHIGIIINGRIRLDGHRHHFKSQRIGAN